MALELNEFDVSGPGFTFFGFFKRGSGTLTLTEPLAALAGVYAGTLALRTSTVTGDLFLGRAGHPGLRPTLRADASLSIGTTTSLADDATIDTNGFTVSMDGPVRQSPFVGGSNLTKIGEGTLILNGPSSLRSTLVFVNAGVLQMGVNAGMASLTLAPSAAFNLAGHNIDLASLNGSGAIWLGGGGLTVGSSNAMVFGGSISGSGSLTKVGSGTLTLGGFNTYAGATMVSKGVLRIGAANSLPAGSVVTVAAGAKLDGDNHNLTFGSLGGGGELQLGSGTLTVGTANTSTAFSGSISSASALTKVGSGTLSLTGINRYLGPTTIAGGTLSVAADSSLGDLSSQVVIDGGTLQMGNGFGSGRLISLGATGGTLGVDGIAALSGTISGTGLFRKTGSGALMLTGANTYTGGTAVEAGTLVGTSTSLQGAIHNNGLLVFAQSSDGTFGSSITGSGGSLKAGTGTVSFTLPQTYTGLTQVAAGRLNVAGLDGSALIDVNATLATSGPIAGSVTVHGIFIDTYSPPLSSTPQSASSDAPVPGIGGDLRLGPNATYAVSAAGSVLATLPVAGTVTIAGSHLELTGDGIGMPRVSTVPLFAAAGGTSGAFGSVTTSSLLEPFLTTRGSMLLLTVERTDLPLAALATTANARGAAAALDVARATASPDLHDVIREIAALPDAAISDVLSDLGGTPYATMARAGALDAQRITRLVSERLGDARSTSSAPPSSVALLSAQATAAPLATSAERPSFWTRAINERVSIDGGAAGERLDGTVLGLDRRVGSRSMVGVFGGYDRATVTVTDTTSSMRERRYRAGGYASTSASAYYVDAAVAGAYKALEANRHVAFAAQLDPTLGGGPLFGGVDRAAVAEVHGFDVSGFTEAGLASGVVRLGLQPFASLDWSRVHHDAFTEHGAGGISLVVQEAATRSARAAIGLRATRSPARSASSRWVPRAEMRYQHELLRSDAAFTAAFAHVPSSVFSVSSDPVGAHSIMTSAGWATILSHRIVISGDYQASFETNRRSQTLSVGIAF